MKRMGIFLGAATVLAVAAVQGTALAAPSPSQTAQTSKSQSSVTAAAAAVVFNVKTYGATGNGSTNHSAAAGGALRINTSSSTQSCSTGTTTRYEAENATLSTGGTVATNHLDFSGTGFVDTPNAVGSYVEWTVTVPTAGTYAATVGYADGTTADRPMDVAVNGTTAAAGASFPATGSWDTWARKGFNVALNAGTNTVRVTATTANGCPDLDYLDVG